METAIKFMGRDGRFEIVANDIEMAVQEMNHGDLLPLVPVPSSRLTGKSELTLSDVFKSILPKMKKPIKENTLKGGYLFFKDKINDNVAKEKIRLLDRQEMSGPVIER